MIVKSLRCLFLLLPFLGLCLLRGADLEIEALLHYVGNLEHVSFIRNGEAHTPAKAEAHMRMKWQGQKDEITCAEEFINLCATRSNVTGEPYVLRYEGGKEESCALVLKRELQRLRAEDKKKQTPKPADK